MSVGLVKACVRRNKSILFIEKSSALTNKDVFSVLQSYRGTNYRCWNYLERDKNCIHAKKCEDVLKLIHEGHLGMNKCKLHVKETVYWPGINDQLEKMILNCKICLKYSQSKCKQKPTMCFGQDIALHLWTKLATDLFHFEGASYPLIVDYTRRFLVVCKLSSMTRQHVAKQYKLIFSEYGWPEYLHFDNGPCYTADAFTSVMSAYHVNPITSSPTTHNPMDLLKSMYRL